MSLTCRINLLDIPHFLPCLYYRLEGGRIPMHFVEYTRLHAECYPRPFADVLCDKSHENCVASAIEY